MNSSTIAPLGESLYLCSTILPRYMRLIFSSLISTYPDPHLIYPHPLITLSSLFSCFILLLTYFASTSSLTEPCIRGAKDTVIKNILFRHPVCEIFLVGWLLRNCERVRGLYVCSYRDGLREDGGEFWGDEGGGEMCGG